MLREILSVPAEKLIKRLLSNAYGRVGGWELIYGDVFFR